MITAGVQLTSEVVWRLTLGVACVDALLILGIRRYLPAVLFGRLSRWITLASFLFFGALWSFVLSWGWDWFYSYIFPAWVRDTGLAWGAAYGGIGLGMVWLSQHLPGRPAVNFCLLGGIEGLLTHLWAIYGMGAVSKPPILHGVDPFTMLIFAIFEITFYWIVILLLAAIASRLYNRLRRPAPTTQTPATSR